MFYARTDSASVGGLRDRNCGMWELPSLVMVAVAIHHRWRMHTCGQSAWKGGGFAMFSTARCHVLNMWLWHVSHDRCEMVAVPDNRSHLRNQAVYVPTPRNIRRLAVGLLDGAWLRLGSVAILCPPSEMRERAEMAAALIQHRTVDFDMTSGTYRSVEGHRVVVAMRRHS